MNDFVRSIDNEGAGPEDVRGEPAQWERGSSRQRGTSFLPSGAPADAPLGVEFVNEPIGPYVRRLREQPGKDIWLMGGGDLIASFLDEAAIDELVITVAPVFIGDGISLIARRHRHVPLELRSVQQFENGVVQLHYRVQNHP
jgi:dihydrofolate reductase